MSKVGGGACDAKVRYPRSAGAIDAHVGSRMRLRRLQLGLTQVDLAQILCVTFQQVQKYEKGVNRMGATRLFHLAMALGVPVQYFFDDIRDEEIDQSQASGFSESPADTPAIKFLYSREGVDLGRAFASISDPKVRGTLIAHIRALADDQVNL